MLDLETEEPAKEHYKSPSFKDVSGTPWTSKAEMKSMTGLEDHETIQDIGVVLSEAQGFEL